MRKEFQSTSPCGGRRDKALCLCIRFEISIHVPLRGTTLLGNQRQRDIPISIHVPLRGTTLKSEHHAQITFRFQSTSPCGGRHTFQHGIVVKGAAFNPRPLAGDDTIIMCAQIAMQHVFNPRPLAGDDTHISFRYFVIFRVSIHVPLRGTTPWKEEVSQGPKGVSIHVPLRGTTLPTLTGMQGFACFNPRPLAGDDTQSRSNYSLKLSFQSTSPCGGRHW